MNLHDGGGGGDGKSFMEVLKIFVIVIVALPII